MRCEQNGPTFSRRGLLDHEARRRDRRESVARAMATAAEERPAIRRMAHWQAIIRLPAVETLSAPTVTTVSPSSGRPRSRARSATAEGKESGVRRSRGVEVPMTHRPFSSGHDAAKPSRLWTFIVPRAEIPNVGAKPHASCGEPPVVSNHLDMRICLRYGVHNNVCCYELASPYTPDRPPPRVARRRPASTRRLTPSGSPSSRKRCPSRCACRSSTCCGAARSRPASAS